MSDAPATPDFQTEADSVNSVHPDENSFGSKMDRMMGMMREMLQVQAEQMTLLRQIRSYQQADDAYGGPVSRIPMPEGGPRKKSRASGSFQGLPHQSGQARTQGTLPVRRQIYCYFCGKKGHMQQECRSRNHQCLACGGSDHVTAQCPRRSARDKGPLLGQSRERPMQSSSSSSQPLLPSPSLDADPVRGVMCEEGRNPEGGTSTGNLIPFLSSISC